MLTHYIFIRKDLPLGVLAAMITHAAGESGCLYHHPYDGRFRGATAVVLEAKSQLELRNITEHLRLLEIPKVEVYESSGPYAGQFMAIGVVPRERDERLREYTCLKALDNPESL
jgi:hypothetical protein